jgi:hypothetical protein
VSVKILWNGKVLVNMPDVYLVESVVRHAKECMHIKSSTDEQLIQLDLGYSIEVAV